MRLDHGEFAEASADPFTAGQVRAWTGDETYGSSQIPVGWKRSWSAPICERCWIERRGIVQPVRAIDPDRSGAKVCAFCGRPTWAGIGVRADPRVVPYPSLELIE